MKDFSPEELESLVKAIAQEPPSKEETSHIPLKSPSSGPISKVFLEAFPPTESAPRKHGLLVEKEAGKWNPLKVKIEVVFGTSQITLGELAELEKGTVFPLEQLVEEPLDIYVNGKIIGKGQMVAVDGNFGIKILILEEKSQNMV